MYLESVRCGPVTMQHGKSATFATDIDFDHSAAIEYLANMFHPVTVGKPVGHEIIRQGFDFLS